MVGTPHPRTSPSEPQALPQPITKPTLLTYYDHHKPNASAPLLTLHDMPNSNRDYWGFDANHPRQDSDPEIDMYDEWNDDDSSESGHAEDDEFREDNDDDYDEHDEDEFSADEAPDYIPGANDTILRMFGSHNLPNVEIEEDEEFSPDEAPGFIPEGLASSLRGTGLEGFAGDSPLARASRRLLLERFMDPLMDFGLENTLRQMRNGTNRPSIVNRLESGDLSEVIDGLEGLSRQLLMGTLPMLNLRNDTEMGKLVEVLVKLLADHENVDVQLLAARCLCRLVESIPSVAPSLMIKHEIVPVLRKKFENMIYIDLIEQLLGLVGPLVNQNAEEFLEAECLVPLVNCFDFFNEYDQKTITSAVEKMAAEIDSNNVQHGEAYLRALPSHPNSITTNCTSALIGSVGHFLDAPLGDLVSEATWNTLVSLVRPSEPNIGNYLQALCEIAKSNIEWVGDIGLLAETVSYALVQQHRSEPGDSSLVSKLLTVPSLALPKSLCLIENILSEAGRSKIDDSITVNGSNDTTFYSNIFANLSLDKLVRCAHSIIPLAMAINTAALSGVECFGNSKAKLRSDLINAYNESGQLVKLLVRILSKNYGGFPALAKELRIVDLAKDLLTENDAQLPGLEEGAQIAYELSQSPLLLEELGASGIAGMIRSYQEKLEREGHSSTDDDRYKRCISILENIDVPENSAEDVVNSVIKSIKAKSDIDFDALKKVPLMDLLNSGFVEQLSDVNIEEYLSKPLVSFFVGIVNKLEHFRIQQSGVRVIRAHGHATIPPIQVTLTPLNNDNESSQGNSYKFYIPPAASLRPIETILKDKVKHEKIAAAGTSADTNAAVEQDQDIKLSFFDINKRKVPQDVSILKALSGLTDDTPTLYFRETNESDEDAPTSDAYENSENSSISDRLRSTLVLLQRLANFNEKSGVVLPWEIFQSAKLTAKVSTQLDDLAAIITSLLPKWVYDTIHEFPFLYSLKIRRLYVQLISLNFGRDPMFVLPGEEEDDDDDFNPDAEDSVVRPFGLYRRQKFRLSRNRLLEGAVRMLEKSSTSSAVVEVMFFDEAGVGRGPTQEFFSLACKELSSPNTKMWKETPFGLFPAPHAFPSDEVLRYFSALGMLISRALLDRRTLDLTLHPAFFEAVVTKEEPSVDRLKRLDPELAKTLETILATPPAEIADMGLDFTMPGSGEDLLPSGSEIPVTKENYVDYVKHVCEYSLGSGISSQIEAFVKGFDSTMSITNLECFMYDELAELCGSSKDQDWSLDALRAAIVPSHGYHSDSKPFTDFLEVLGNLDYTDRRLFLMFATGSPNLPVGGFKALTPPFTVVIKYPEDESLGYDVYLPSVMTCTNYFKLPAYSNKEIMRLRLRTAFSEGAGLFALS